MISLNHSYYNIASHAKRIFQMIIYNKGSILHYADEMHVIHVIHVIHVNQLHRNRMLIVKHIYIQYYYDTLK